MKASKIKKIWIVIRSIWATFLTSIFTLINSLIRKKPRKKNDAILKKWADKIIKIVKLSYEISNPYNISFDPNRCYIIMSNHASQYDIPLIIMAFPNKSIRMIAKKELFKVPIWGKAMTASEFVSIDRTNGRQAIKDLENAIKKMQSGIIPWIAPEGTRTRTGKLGPFKKGGFMIAQKTKAIIIPVGIKGSYEVLPPKTLDFNIGQNVKINIGKPIDTAKYDNSDKNKLMKDVEISIRELINEPIN